jgi:cephalosporin-C deacetylase-like acetyl esterase
LQTRDYLDAFDFASALPDVDPVRIIFWGSSMSGGNAICAAALEKRVRAVIAQVPFVSGELASGEFASLMTVFLEERGAVREVQHQF